MTKTKMLYNMVLVSLLIVPLCAILLMSFAWKHDEVQHGVPGVFQNAVVQDTPDIAPVDLTKVTKVVLFGEIMDTRINEVRNHTGIDFELGKGSDVVATADGVVIVQNYGEKPGNYVVIKHSETFSTRYYHLESALVKHGDKVKRNQVIGLVGNTGLSSIPHLHYEVLKNGRPVDPKDHLPGLPRL